MKKLLSGLLGLAYVAAIVALEIKRPLRPGKREGKLRRDVRNLAIASLGGATTQLLEGPLVRPLSRKVEVKRWGLLKQARLPIAVEVAAGVALMDYTLYVWHVLTHKVPFLWRFHAAHHVDLDMDASTAIRFHFGELACSVPYRALQVLVFGVGPRTFSAWQAFTFASILFHHSNMDLPKSWERRLQWLVETPRLHGIHHGSRPYQTDSNWSSGLSIWDRLHGTFRNDVPQRALTIGVAGIDEPKQVTLGRTLALPFAHPPAVDQFRASA